MKILYSNLPFSDIEEKNIYSTSLISKSLFQKTGSRTISLPFRYGTLESKDYRSRSYLSSAKKNPEIIHLYINICWYRKWARSFSNVIGT